MKCRRASHWLLPICVAMSMMSLIAAVGDIGQRCEFAAIDAATDASIAFERPSLLKNVWPWKSDFATRDFARAILGNVSVKVTN